MKISYVGFGGGRQRINKNKLNSMVESMHAAFTELRFDHILGIRTGRTCMTEQTNIIFHFPDGLDKSREVGRGRGRRRIRRYICNEEPKCKPKC